MESEISKINISRSTEITLDYPVQYLKGVGPKVAGILKRQGVETVRDALQMLPRTYEDLRTTTTISKAEPGKEALIVGTLGPIRIASFRRNRRIILDAFLDDATGRITLKWFNARIDYLKTSFPAGSRVLIKGTISLFQGQKVIIHPVIKLLNEEELFVPRISPIYTEHEKLPQFRLQKLMLQALTAAKEIEDPLPENIRQKLGFPNLSNAILLVHSPKNSDNFEDLLNFESISHKRIIFDELFFFELFVLTTRANRIKENGISFQIKNNFTDSFRLSLPFKLTLAQEDAIKEIYEDMKNASPMHRLLQGDVGSGKTVVGFFAALLAIENDYQVALMAPTEILVEQHFWGAKNLLEPLGISVALLTSNLTNAERREILSNLLAGKIHILIGTHALFQEDVVFKNLGLVIIDEQHRFGVEQRVALKQKGVSSDLLVLTATPIPRTLALSFYGDLDITTIRELPPGRAPIQTSIVTEDRREEMYSFLEKEMESGGQVYVVLPLINESEKVDLKNAVSTAELLKIRFSNKKIGLLHGGLKSEDKDAVMELFKSGKINLLVSTTIIEVGVDVSNASIMVIEHAERFGLSQLHQLRGRVGRGTKKGFCFLVTEKKYLNKSIEIFKTIQRRLNAMVNTTDGFKLAEEDLNIRGPGELLGTKQSGLPTFRYANLSRDFEILTLARDEALKLLKEDPELNDPQHINLKTQWERFKKFASAS